MVLRAALAAALLAAVLGGACKPSSTSPLFIGTKGPEDYNSARDGFWAGVTSVGNPVEFQVGSGQIADFRMVTFTGSCARAPQVTGVIPIEGDTFTLEVLFTTGSRLTLFGVFLSSTECTGNYTYRAAPEVGESCPDLEEGPFRAGRIG